MCANKPRRTNMIWKQIWLCWSCINSIQACWIWTSLIWFCWKHWPTFRTPISRCASVFCCQHKWKTTKCTTSLNWPIFSKSAILNCSGPNWRRRQISLSTLTDSSIRFANTFAMSLASLSSQSLVNILNDFWEMWLVSSGIQLSTKERSINRFVWFTDDVLNSWVKKNEWKDQGELIHVTTQDINIKTKNITEKIEFENLGPVMTSSCL